MKYLLATLMVVVLLSGCRGRSIRPQGISPRVHNHALAIGVKSLELDKVYQGTTIDLLYRLPEYEKSKLHRFAEEQQRHGITTAELGEAILNAYDAQLMNACIEKNTINFDYQTAQALCRGSLDLKKNLNDPEFVKRLASAALLLSK